MRDKDDVSTVHVPPVLPDGIGRTLPEGVLHRNIEEAICAFGRGVLTAREQAVVQLILRGLPSKVVASELQIALKTEKVHRRNAYAKLGVNSHAVLFGQFLQFLSASLEPRPSTAFIDARLVAAAVVSGRARHEPPLMAPRTRAGRTAPRGTDEGAPSLGHAVLRDVRNR
ncbi:MAG: helix-turn-helix transcriptional regulator [Steroidobacteraceae bacterium]|jgi:DNA-binding CsgD family transcriptional regulator|nr:helix-turn-helix transcriptional regulator [Steroidobacteraceae bacterium]